MHCFSCSIFMRTVNMDVVLIYMVGLKDVFISSG